MKKLPLVAALLGVALVLLIQIATTPHYSVFKPAPTPDIPGSIAGGDTPSLPIMQIFISVIVLGAGLWVVLSRRYQPQEKHWAYGAIGTIIGFWLKG